MKWISCLTSDPALLLSLLIVIIGLCIIVVVIILLYRLKNEKKVTRAALELKKITNSIRAGLVHFVLEDNCKILYASQGFYDILGFDKLEMKAQNKNSLKDFIDYRDLGFVEEIRGQLDHDTIRCDVRMLTKDGTILHMLMNGNSVTGRDGKHTLSVVFVDITEQKRMQEQILLEGERYRIATELSNDILFEYRIKKDELKHSDKYRDIFGLDPVIANYSDSFMKVRERIYPDDWGIYLEICHQILEGKSSIEAQLRIKNRLGEFIWCQFMGKTIYDDNHYPLRVIGKIVNVDSQKRELEALEFKATRNPLTGVYNKEVTIKKIEKFISGNKNGRHILMLIDFDDFKSINDNYGHLVGDKVLIYIIGRIKEVFSEGEILGRIGGDEFVVFTGNIENDEDIIYKADLIKSKLDTYYEVDDNSIKISASIGVVIYPEAGNHYEQLMEQADKALYRVKEQGKNNYLLYKPSI